MNNVGESWLKGRHIDKTSINSRPVKICYCIDLTDSYNLTAQGNKYNNSDIAQMSFN